MNSKSDRIGSSTKFVMMGEKRIPLVRIRKLKRLHKKDSSDIFDQLNFQTYPLQLMTKDSSSYAEISEKYRSRKYDLSVKNQTFRHSNGDIFNHVLGNNLAKLKEYINEIKNPIDIINMPIQDDLMQTPLHVSILNRCSLEVVQFLLDNGADIMEPDKEYRNALNYSLDIENSSYFDLLIQHVCKCPFSTLEKLVGSREFEKICLNNSITADAYVIQKIFTTIDIEGNTLIMQCILKKKILILKNILSKIESNIPLSIMRNIINYQNPRNGKTALCMIADQDSVFSNASKICATLLLKHGACVKIKNFHGFNVIDYACKLKNYNYYEFLNDFFVLQDTQAV